MNTFISVSRLWVKVRQIYVCGPLSRWFMARFFVKIFALKSRCRRKSTKIGSFGPHISGKETIQILDMHLLTKFEHFDEVCLTRVR